MVAAAIVGGAVIAGGASVIAGNSAAKAQKKAAAGASDTELRMFEQNREDLAPYREAGYTALKQLGEGTAEGGDFMRDFTLADFDKDPGRQFRFDTGQQALERSAAARGGVMNGGTLKALARYGQDYATQEYSSAYQRFNADRDRRFNRLSSLAGTGQTATTTTAQLGANAAGGAADAQIQAGNATAAARINAANAASDTANTLGQFYLQRQYMNQRPAPAAGAGG